MQKNIIKEETKQKIEFNITDFFKRLYSKNFHDILGNDLALIRSIKITRCHNGNNLYMIEN